MKLLEQHGSTPQYVAYRKLNNNRLMFLVDDTFFMVGFLGTGAIYTWVKEGRKYTFAQVSHPHYKYASPEMMLFTAYDVIIAWIRWQNILGIGLDNIKNV